MDPAHQANQDKIITLEEAALLLGVSIGTLRQWNEHNILKPTITPAGEVGYRQEQINQFLTIRKLTQDSRITPQQPILAESVVVPPVVSIEPDTFVPSPASSRKSFSASPLFAFILSFSATVFSLVVFLKSVPSGADVRENVLASQISKSSLPESAASKNLKLEGLAETSTSESAKTAELTNDPSANNFLSYSQTANFTPDKESPESEFDTSGNIKGKTASTDVLAAVVGTSGMIQGSSVRQTVDLNILLAVLTAGFLAIPLIFKKPSATMVKKLKVSDVPQQKIIEVNQKTDGTVVLCYQGQEFKVSKPELDSESDQFIERLMELVTPGVKEIDYDAQGDRDIKISAPLSKLVTRLGFVGLKRDLFFPRTSKNRVLFRRYLTQDDLTSMHLNPGQITSVFLSSN